MTRVASSGYSWDELLNEYSAASPIDGTSISSTATTGTPLLLTLAAASGSTRSNAAAKITRVEDRNSVPTHPKNHSDMIATRMNWSTWLPKNDAAISAGYGNTGVAPVPA